MSHGQFSNLYFLSTIQPKNIGGNAFIGCCPATNKGNLETKDPHGASPFTIL